MRRGAGAGEQKIGGAWDRAAIMRAQGSMPWDSVSPGTTPKTTGEKEAPCTDDGWPKAARIAGMVLQQSCP